MGGHGALETGNLKSCPCGPPTIINFSNLPKNTEWEGIYGSNEWQQDRMRDGALRVNSPRGCFNELISPSLRMKREKKNIPIF